MKFANILLETNPRSVTYPALYCRSDQPVVFDEQLGEWEMYKRWNVRFQHILQFLVGNEIEALHACERILSSS